MYDGVGTDAPAIGRRARPGDLAAGYGDGLYAWSAADWAHIPPGVTRVVIVVFATTDDGVVLDCEPGNCTPAQAVDWVLMRRRAGIDPTVYCNRLDPAVGWPAVRAAFEARGAPEPHWWVADYSVDQSNPQIPPGAIALQYTDTGSYDLSIVADHWPGVDPPQEADMPLTVADGDLVADRTENRQVGTVAVPVPAALPEKTTLGMETASGPGRWMWLAAQLAALQRQLAAVASPPPAQVDLAALETLLEQHLAAGSVPGVIAAAVAKHLGADLSTG